MKQPVALICALALASCDASQKSAELEGALPQVFKEMTDCLAAKREYASHFGEIKRVIDENTDVYQNRTQMIKEQARDAGFTRDQQYYIDSLIGAESDKFNAAIRPYVKEEQGYRKKMMSSCGNLTSISSTLSHLATISPKKYPIKSILSECGLKIRDIAERDILVSRKDNSEAGLRALTKVESDLIEYDKCVTQVGDAGRSSGIQLPSIPEPVKREPYTAPSQAQAASEVAFTQPSRTDCKSSNIASIGNRIDGEPDSGDTVTYSNGLGQISYSAIVGLSESQIGDPVIICVNSRPLNCPPGDNRGTVYEVINERTGKKWIESDSTHSCGGA